MPAELVVDVAELLLEPANVLGDAARTGGAGEAEAVLLGDEHVEQLAPAREQRRRGPGAASSGSGRGSGRTRSANWARIGASIASVLAS